jgi:hypothetical protein
MDKDIFKERGRGEEEAYFHQQDAKLIERLHQEAKLEEIASALAEKLHVDNPELLGRVMALGTTVDSAPAFFLAPLVQVAWAEGTVSEPERETVLRLARARGVESPSPAYTQLCAWLRERPGDALFDTAVEVIKYGFAVLPPAEQEERIKRVVQACHEVATASGGGLAKVLGLGSGVSSAEASLLDTITSRLRSHR